MLEYLMVNVKCPAKQAIKNILKNDFIIDPAIEKEVTTIFNSWQNGQNQENQAIDPPSSRLGYRKA